MDRYKPVELVRVRDVELCDRCGSLVMNRPQHDVWHEQVREGKA